MRQLIDNPLSDPLPYDFAQLEAKTVDNMLLLKWRLAAPKQ
ncbi:hypothetical protein DET57_105168 [Klebsiella oxytoca]|uniref:Uncharacterized protein n=1 Tax=Klebsiella oxytoca TaxID=571 RepID=A0A318FVH4_KLEOX|nr:hypothetical protein DET57_105168 [Klebsiella oxytoca]